MGEFSFDCLDVQPRHFAAGPELLFRLRITAPDEEPIHSVALRCQIRVEPQRRDYAQREQELLGHLFGARERWGQTLRPMPLAHVSLMVPGFTGSTEVELPVMCTYDMEVASGKYFHALREGVVPLVLLFSGTVFGKGDKGFWVRQVPWHQQAEYRMPVTVWQQLMDEYFPSSTWIRLHHETVDALLRYQSGHAIPTWDAAVRTLLSKAGEEVS